VIYIYIHGELGFTDHVHLVLIFLLPAACSEKFGMQNSDSPSAWRFQSLAYTIGNIVGLGIFSTAKRFCRSPASARFPESLGSPSPHWIGEKSHPSLDSNGKSYTIGSRTPDLCWVHHSSGVVDVSPGRVPETATQIQVLTLKKLGIDDLVHFDFLDPPAPETMMPRGLGSFCMVKKPIWNEMHDNTHTYVYIYIYVHIYICITQDFSACLAILIEIMMINMCFFLEVRIWRQPNKGRRFFFCWIRLGE